MRISDWSSDVCSSDLIGDENSLNRVVTRGKPVEADRKAVGLRIDGHGAAGRQMFHVDTESGWTVHSAHLTGFDLCRGILPQIGRASCREGSVSTCRYRWSKYN